VSNKARSRLISARARRGDVVIPDPDQHGRTAVVAGEYVSDQIHDDERRPRLRSRPQNPRPPPPQLLSLSEVTALLGVSRTCVWNWSRKDKFPQSIDVNGLPRWYAHEIQAFLDSRPRSRLKGSGRG
jgi:predicted DNA-binding transcriptional regulator AlpA